MSKTLLYLLLLVGTVATYMLAINPLYTGQGGVLQPEKSVQDLMALNSQYDDALNRADTLMGQAAALKADYSKINDADKAKMAIMVPDSVDRVRLLSEVLKIAADAGFILSDVSFADGSVGANGKGTASVLFSVRTTYPQFKVLMNNFEKSMRLYSIDSVSFSAPQKEGDQTMFQVKLQTYYLK